MPLPLSIKQLKNLNFPLYGLKTEDIRYQDGLVLANDLVVDDRNQTGNRLGIRRLQTPHKLYSLKRNYGDIASILKDTERHFIDTKGNIFTYKKTLFVPLKYHKIKKIESKKVASLLWCYEMDFTLTIKRPPPDGFLWAGILYYQQTPWLLYEFSEDKKSDSRRKI